MDKWTFFVAALGLALALEGLPYFISPRAVRSYVQTLSEAGDGVLRGLGFTMIAIGLLIVYVSTR